MEVEGKNFLIPVDFDSGSDKVDVEVEAMEMDRVQAQLKGFRVQTRLLVVDAYRNDPWNKEPGAKDLAGGWDFSAIQADRDLIVYTTGERARRLTSLRTAIWGCT